MGAVNNRIAAGGALVAASVLGFASPAAADAGDDDEVSQELSFTYEGTPYVCTLTGRSAYQYVTDDDATFIEGRTQWTGEGCDDVVQSTGITIIYTPTGDRERAATGSSNGSAVQNSFVLPGTTDDVRATHSVTYDCDEGVLGSTTCQSQVLTNPK